MKRLSETYREVNEKYLMSNDITSILRILNKINSIIINFLRKLKLKNYFSSMLKG